MRCFRQTSHSGFTTASQPNAGSASCYTEMGIVMRNAADTVTQVVIPRAGHWLMEEAPTQTIRAIREFIAQ